MFRVEGGPVGPRRHPHAPLSGRAGERGGGGLARERALGAHLLAVEPEEDGEGDAEDDGEAGEEGVAAAEPELVVHLLAEEREGEAEHGAEDGGGGERARGVGEGVDEVELDGQAAGGVAEGQWGRRVEWDVRAYKVVIIPNPKMAVPIMGMM